MKEEQSNVIVEIYSSVWKGSKENQEWTNGDYFQLVLYIFLFLNKFEDSSGLPHRYLLG